MSLLNRLPPTSDQDHATCCCTAHVIQAVQQQRQEHRISGRRISAADVISHFQGEGDGEAFFLGSDDDLGMNSDSSSSENDPAPT